MELAKAFEIGQQRAMSIRQAQIDSSARPVDRAVSAKSRNDREKIGELVGSIFYNTLIKQMQNSSLKTPLFHGGRGEEAFNSQLAAELSDRIGRSKQEPVSNAIYRAIERSRKS